MNIHLTLNGQVIPATLAHHRTASEFAAMLPVTITLHDLFRREKFGALPNPVSVEGTRAEDYEVGDIVCWSAGPDLAVMYRHDGQSLSGGFQVLGRLDFGAEAFAGDGPLTVTIESAKAPIRAGQAAASSISPRPSGPSWPCRRSSSSGSCGSRI